jgi:hypothetical protein
MIIKIIVERLQWRKVIVPPVVAEGGEPLSSEGKASKY